jgi:cytoplasmic iron level regulating protein YaaA (DUF328/UPF0246 family)
MLAVISPAKALDFDTPLNGLDRSEPIFLDDTVKLAKTARRLSRRKLSNMMGISAGLADLNWHRFQAFAEQPSADAARQAALAFNGDTYRGLEAPTLGHDDMDYAQDHLRILSGLYGLLRPLDVIQPYRLEMGVRIHTRRGETLYDFWGDRITKELNKASEGHDDRTLINLASAEYFKAVRPKKLAGAVVTPVFKEEQGGMAKVIGFLAKKARGMMARHMVENRIDRPEGLKDFASEGYRFQPAQSDATTWVFTRETV